MDAQQIFELLIENASIMTYCLLYPLWNDILVKYSFGVSTFVPYLCVDKRTSVDTAIRCQKGEVTYEIFSFLLIYCVLFVVLTFV